jgi:ketopantoate reductase
MRTLVIGAGPVGVLLGRALEAQKGNEVIWLVRKGAKVERWKIVRARTETMSVRERPVQVEPDQALPAVDVVLIATRAEQLDEALAIVDELPPAVRVATATPGIDDLQKIRARRVGPACQILPMFMAWNDADTLRWMSVSFVPTLVADGGDEGSKPFAEEIAAALDAGGLKSRSIGTPGRAHDAALAAGLPLLGALELAGWDFSRLGANPELRRLAADAAKEGLSAIAGALGVLGAQPILSLMLRATPRLPADVQAMWRVHGPKIASQTRVLLDGVYARTRAAGGRTTRLGELRERLAMTQSR